MNERTGEKTFSARVYKILILEGCALGGWLASLSELRGEMIPSRTKELPEVEDNGLRQVCINRMDFNGSVHGLAFWGSGSLALLRCR